MKRGITLITSIIIELEKKKINQKNNQEFILKKK
jgi:hypothetical protein